MNLKAQTFFVGIITVCLLFSGCETGRSGQAPLLFGTEEPKELAGYLVPPDPGFAGKQTIEGIDSNHNGVRDDVERAILFGFHDKISAEAMEYAFLKARIQQKKLLLADKPEECEDFAHINKMAFDALAYHTWFQSAEGEDMILAMRSEAERRDYRIFSDLLDTLEDQTANTRERAKLFRRYLSNISGMVFDVAPDTRSKYKPIFLHLEKIKEEMDAEL